MAELLIRAVDKTNPADIYLDCKLTKQFDVIAVCENGWAWSYEERTSPAWRILALPNVTVAQAESLLRPEEGDPLVQRTLQRRGWRLNTKKPTMPKAIRDWWDDATRAEPIRTLTYTWAQVSAFVEQKSPVPDPAVIG